MDELNRLIRFLKYDLDIKKIMVSSAPNYDSSLSENMISDYSDRLYYALKDIEFDFNRIFELYPKFNEDKDYVKNMFSAFYEKLATCNNYEKLKNFHIACISDLSEHVVDNVANNCFGHSCGINVSLTTGNTVNEMLHIMHQSIVNDNESFKDMPLINRKINDEEFPINLYGNSTKIGNDIYNAMPLDMSMGNTDIISISEDMTIIMVRDRGHALLIEVEKEQDKYYAKYFIPKICNADMVNRIKGVKKVDEHSSYTHGSFEIKNDIGQEIVDLIRKVPTDADIGRTGEPIYNIALEYNRDETSFSR